MCQGLTSNALYSQYCRRLGLNYASFAVLTPLNGTDLYAGVKDQLITRNYSLVDFIHPLLPTSLPIKEFDHEYRHFHMTAMPVRRQLSWLRKMSMKEIPGTIAKGRRFYSRLTIVHKDDDE